MRKIAILIVTGALLLLGVTPVYAVPALPHAFYGNVTINGSPAPIGTMVSATGAGVTTGIPQNPLTTTVAGEYGSDGLYLLVQGDISSGATITFYVNGVSTGQTATFEIGGGPTVMNLTVTIPTGGVGIVLAPDIEATLFGVEGEFSIDDDGIIQETIEATSDAGDFTITIPEGAVALDVDGDPLSTLTVELDLDPPDPPAEAHIIGIPYKLGPAGATFDPAITIEYTVDPATLPLGVAVEDLVIAYYDEVAGEWVELPTTYDPATNTFTADVDHFTTFAIIGRVPAPAPLAPAAFSVASLSIQPAEVESGETVTIAVSVANTGGESGSYTVVLKVNGVKEAEERVTIAAGSSQTVTFSVTKEEAGSYTVTVDGLSGSFTVVSVVVPPAPAAFSVSYLSVSPQLEVEPGETVTISVLVANTGGESGSYTVVLKIDGVKEAEETVTVAAGESQDVNFSVTREVAGSYTVAVNGLSGSFTVVASPEEEEVPTKPGVNWFLIGGIIGGVIVVGLGVFFFVRRTRAY